MHNKTHTSESNPDSKKQNDEPRKIFDWLVEKHPTLSPTELKICRYLYELKNSTDIAVIMAVDKRTIDNHRSLIRKKLNLARNVNLTTYLRIDALSKTEKTILP